jgi:integrase
MTGLEPAWPAVVVRPAEPAPPARSDADYTVSAETITRLLGATPENTRRAYDRNWGQFERWCAGHSRTSLPATPHTLADYVVRLIGMSLAPATIDQAIGTIRSKHAAAGYRDQPETREALKLLRAYRHEWADAGGRVRKAKPVLIDALRAMADTCDRETPKGRRDRALLLLGFNGMCRRSELAGLDIADIVNADGEGILLHIRYSKTDQAARGAAVSVPFGQHAGTCAVRSTHAWTAELADRGITSGPLFRPVDRHGRVGGEDGRAGKPGARLTGKSVSDIVRRRAVLAGLPDADRYTGHGLRAGSATSAYLAGAPVAEIAAHGRWSATSPVVLGYIRAVDQWNNNPMKGIGL